MKNILTIEKIREREKSIYDIGIIIGIIYECLITITLLAGIIYNDFIFICIGINMILNTIFSIIMILMVGNYVDEIALKTKNNYKKIMNSFYEKNSK